MLPAEAFPSYLRFGRSRVPADVRVTFVMEFTSCLAVEMQVRRIRMRRWVKQGGCERWHHHAGQRLRPTAHHKADLLASAAPRSGRHSSARTIPGATRSMSGKKRATCSRVRDVNRFCII